MTSRAQTADTLPTRHSRICSECLTLPRNGALPDQQRPVATTAARFRGRASPPLPAPSPSREHPQQPIDGELPAGALAGEYVIRARLASGGFGTVYRAEHRVLGRVAAIKVIH